MALSTGLLTKLEIQAFSDEDYQSEGDTFKVQINPKSISLNDTMEYYDQKPPGVNGSSPRFKAIGPQCLKIDFVLDGTGVVSLPVAPLGKSVKKQITELKNVVSYSGKEHEPFFLQVRWGDNIKFNGRLKTMNVEYTLFKPSGDPLRAKVNLEFSSYSSAQTLAKMADDTSPDLTHMITVKEGDTLPLLCYKVYKDSSYYVQVAEVNGLDSFTKLKPGTRLSFPPLTN